MRSCYCALLQLACGGLDECHDRITPFSWDSYTLFGGPPVLPSLLHLLRSCAHSEQSACFCACNANSVGFQCVGGRREGCVSLKSCLIETCLQSGQVEGSIARDDATYIHHLVHMREGQHPGEFGTGWNNAGFWAGSVGSHPTFEQVTSHPPTHHDCLGPDPLRLVHRHTVAAHHRSGVHPDMEVGIVTGERLV